MQPVAPETQPEGAETVLVLRNCNADMSSHGGFVWPEAGYVAAPDWSPEAECGHGLHGWLWGEGDASCSERNNTPGARWLAVRVIASELVDLSGKVKFPRGWVVCCGTDAEATAYLYANGARGRRVIHGQDRAGDAGTATAGYAGTATAGYAGTATAGVRGTATAGDEGTATAGVRGTATAGYAGTATAGVRGTATAGDEGTATAGDAGTATAGDEGTATAGYAGTATAGVRGTATAGDAGTATAGYAGTATAGYAGTATAGVRGTATAGVRGTATAGDEGQISLCYWDDAAHRMRRVFGAIGEGGLEPGVPYVLDASHKFAKKASR